MSYSCDDVAMGTIKLLMQNARDPPNPDGTQREASFWLRREILHEYPHTKMEDEKDLGFFLKLYDDDFFFGTLSQWTRVEFVDERENRPKYGFMKDDPEKLAPHVLISIVRRKHSTYGTRDVTEETLRILLHEMAHAMIEVFRCRCHCSASTGGITGHGPSWLKLGVAFTTGDATAVAAMAGL